MAKLICANMHPDLNEYVIRLLNKRGIETLTDFWSVEEKKLMQIMNIDDLHSFSSIKRALAVHYGIAPINGLVYYNNLMCRPAHLPTHIRELDEILHGGLAMGSLIDICGPPDAGKTQLCTSIAINLAQFDGGDTLWIDTKGDFSAERIQHILRNRKCPETEIREIMQRIHIETCFDHPAKLIEMIETLIVDFDEYKNAKLLVIDSLPALWFLYHGEEPSFGAIAMTTLTNNLRELAVECGMVVLVVNLASRFSQYDLDDGAKPSQDDLNEDEDDTDDGQSITNTNISSETFVPCLGKFWQSICTTRLLIRRPGTTDLAFCNDEDTDESVDLTQRDISIMKCNQLRTGGQCTVNISDIGVRSNC